MKNKQEVKFLFYFILMETIMRNYSIEENKKKKEINKLKEYNKSMKHMTEGVKAAYEEKLVLK